MSDSWSAFYVSEVTDRFGFAGLELVGSLPLLSNIYALCVSPTLADFLPPASRLVTLSRKDLLTNQSFRCDIYAKSPTAFQLPEDRLSAAGNFYFRLADRGHTLSYKQILRSIAFELSGPPHDTLFEMLSQRSWQLAEIAAFPGLAGLSLEDLFEAIDLATATGLFYFDAGPLHALPAELPTESSGPFTLNGVFNHQQVRNLPVGEKTITLASLATGTGHSLKILHAIILDELVSGENDGL